MPETPEKDRPVQFRDFVFDLGEGEAHQQLTDLLARITKAMRVRALSDHGKAKGELSIKVTLVTDETLAVSAKYDINFKEPKAPRPNSILWLDAHGNLTPQNPKQQQLPGVLREVPRHGGAPREVLAPATGEIREV